MFSYLYLVVRKTASWGSAKPGERVLRTWKSLCCLTGSHPILTILLMLFAYLPGQNWQLPAGHVGHVLLEIPAEGNKQSHNSQVFTALVTPLSIS